VGATQRVPASGGVGAASGSDVNAGRLLGGPPEREPAGRRAVHGARELGGGVHGALMVAASRAPEPYGRLAARGRLASPLRAAPLLVEVRVERLLDLAVHVVGADLVLEAVQTQHGQDAGLDVRQAEGPQPVLAADGRRGA